AGQRAAHTTLAPRCPPDQRIALGLMRHARFATLATSMMCPPRCTLRTLTFGPALSTTTVRVTPTGSVKPLAATAETCTEWRPPLSETVTVGVACGALQAPPSTRSRKAVAPCPATWKLTLPVATILAGAFTRVVVGGAPRSD